MERLVKPNNKKQIAIFVMLIIIIVGAGVTSGFFNMKYMNTYNSLIKPIFAPSSWVFLIVWIVIYLLMTTVLFRIWFRGKQVNYEQKSIIYFFIQIALNSIWPFIFFRFNLYGLAFLELLLLLIFILLTVFEFYKIDKLASFLMIPYILWVSFAGVLSYIIWMFNEM